MTQRCIGCAHCTDMGKLKDGGWGLKVTWS